MKRIPLLAAAVLVAAVSLAPTPALASGSYPDDESLQSRIDAVLLAFPDGVQIADDTVAWERGEVALTLAGGSSARSIGNCATGKYCAWSAFNYGGSKLSFSSCSLAGSSNSLAPLGSNARSLANARTSGTVKAKNGATVVHTLAAGVGIPSNVATLTTMVCFS